MTREGPNLCGGKGGWLESRARGPCHRARGLMRVAEEGGGGAVVEQVPGKGCWLDPLRQGLGRGVGPEKGPGSEAIVERVQNEEAHRLKGAH